MGHATVRRVALTSFAVNLFCLLALVLASSVIYAPEPLHSEPKALSENISLKETQSVQLPMEIPCTSLTVESMAMFEGAFFEDGSGRYVCDVAALLVYNNSNSIIPYADIRVETGGTQLRFCISMLMPQSYVLVPEISAQQYEKVDITQIHAWHTVEKENSCLPIYIAEQDDVSLYVENRSEKDLQDLKFYYKKYTDGIYIGGRAFEFTVPSLPAGESTTFSPVYYVSGYTRMIYQKEDALTGQ